MKTYFWQEKLVQFLLKRKRIFAIFSLIITLIILLSLKAIGMNILFYFWGFIFFFGALFMANTRNKIEEQFMNRYQGWLTKYEYDIGIRSAKDHLDYKKFLKSDDFLSLPQEDQLFWKERFEKLGKGFFIPLFAFAMVLTNSIIFGVFIL